MSKEQREELRRLAEMDKLELAEPETIIALLADLDAKDRRIEALQMQLNQATKLDDVNGLIVARELIARSPHGYTVENDWIGYAAPHSISERCDRCQWLAADDAASLRTGEQGKE